MLIDDLEVDDLDVVLKIEEAVRFSPWTLRHGRRAAIEGYKILDMAWLGTAWVLFGGTISYPLLTEETLMHVPGHLRVLLLDWLDGTLLGAYPRRLSDVVGEDEQLPIRSVIGQL